jgi:hypothetical protein
LHVLFHRHPPVVKMGKKEDDDAIQIFLDWANDDAQVRKWQRDLKLQKVLGPRPRDMDKAAKGRDSDAMLVQIKGVLPPRIADGAAAIIARVADSKWNTLEGDGDPAKPSMDGIRAAHRFGAVVDPSPVHGGPELLKALARLMPPADNRHASFHLGRYEEGDFLAPQNDAAYCAVDAGSKDASKAGQIIKCSRDVGIMLFLSKNRTEAGGGLLRDLHYQYRADHKGATYVPEFNSLIAFHIPREYEITPVLSDDPVLSVFGWYLQEGELYDLRPPAPAGAEDQSKKKSIKEKAKAAKRKMRLKAKREEKLSTVPAFLQALAAERETARQNKEFSRADAIRAQCLKAGFRFNAGGKLVKITDTASEEAPKDVKEKDVKERDNSSVRPRETKQAPEKRDAGEKRTKEGDGLGDGASGDGPAKKKKESKAQRLQRQAKLAAAEAAAAAGEEKEEAGMCEGKGDGDDDVGSSGGLAKKGVDDVASKKKRKKLAEDVAEDSGRNGESGGGDRGGALVDEEDFVDKKDVKRKRKASEAAGGAGGDGSEGGQGSEASLKARKGKKKGNAERLMALGAQSQDQSFASVEKGNGANGITVARQDSEGGGGKEGEEGSIETGKDSSKKAPKKPKKLKVAQEAGGSAGGEADSSEPQTGRRGRGMDMLLARIKNKGWMTSGPAPSQL